MPYEELVGQFSSTSTPSDYSQLRRWLIALQHVVSQLGQRQSSLVESIVHMPWTTSPDESFVKSYIEFIGMLITARAEWRGIAVASVARRLTHRGYLLWVLSRSDVLSRLVSEYFLCCCTLSITSTTRHIKSDFCTITSSPTKFALTGSHSPTDATRSFPPLLCTQKPQCREP